MAKIVKKIRDFKIIFIERQLVFILRRQKDLFFLKILINSYYAPDAIFFQEKSLRPAGREEEALYFLKR